jgi:plasmid stability protein
MRTTLDLPDELFRELKATAAKRGTSLKALLRNAVENELARSAEPRRDHRVRLPILKSREPGTLDLTNADIEDLLT